MSRIGKNPVPVPDKVTVSLNGLTVKVKGPKGELELTLPDGVSVSRTTTQSWLLHPLASAFPASATACAAPSSPT